MTRELPDSGTWFTRRERQVLSLLRRGRCNKEIARDLGISLHTAKWHVSQLLTRLGLRNRLALALWARDNPQSFEVGLLTELDGEIELPPAA